MPLITGIEQSHYGRGPANGGALAQKARFRPGTQKSHVAMVRCSKRLCKSKSPHKPSPIAPRGIADAVCSTDWHLHLSRAIRKFRRAFPKGFRDETYLDWERNYKWQAHLEWQGALGPKLFQSLVRNEEYQQIARVAINIESRTNLLFSFEKMAIRDAVASKLARVDLQSVSTAFFMGMSP